MVAKMIPYGHQSIDSGDIQAVLKVLRSDWLTQGPLVGKFEDALCKYTGARYAVAVSNGTAALHLACLAAEVGPGDEVITSPITFLASANCALYCGAKPVFCDVEEDTANINYRLIKNCITKKTKVIIPVHYAGHPCKMKEIHNVARKNKILVIEDAAHALGSRYNKSLIGSCKYSDMTIFSFHPVKAITTAEGGAIFTNQPELYKKLLMLRNHGMTRDNFMNSSDGQWYYEMQALGYNYRLTDIQSALGVSQLKKLNNFIKRRRQIVAIYNKAFLKNPYFYTPVEHDYAYSSYHLYPIRLKNQYVSKRSEIFSALRKNGIGVQVHYIPVYRQPFYKKLGFKVDRYPVAEDFYSREISLPIYPDLKNSDIKTVIQRVLNVFRESQETL